MCVANESLPKYEIPRKRHLKFGIESNIVWRLGFDMGIFQVMGGPQSSPWFALHLLLPREADSACKYRLPKSGDTGGGTSVLASLGR